MDDLSLRIAWRRHVAAGRDAESELESLLSRHRAAHRHYHTVTHVGWVVRHVERLAGQLTDVFIDRAVAAAFYHDAIYDPTRSDNEHASAVLADERLAELGWDAASIAHVAAMIEATAAHAPDDDLTTAVVLAADLGVLAASPNDYSDYVRQVRREYRHVAEAAWVGGRAAVLNGLLALDALYDPRVAPPGWEARARANLTAELAGLSLGSDQ